MRHRHSGRQLNRNSSHRKAMFRNMTISLVEHELIKTTLPTAKELRNSRQGDPVQRMQRMREHLDLSDEQVREMQQIREQGGSREDMQAVLTDKQRTQLEQARAAHKGKNRPAD